MIKFRISKYESQIWYQNDEYHRIDGPACTWNDTGELIWYQNGLYHREDGPAVICRNDGKQWWYENNKLIKLIKNDQTIIMVS